MANIEGNLEKKHELSVKPVKPVKSAERVFTMLELFEREKRGLTVKEIAYHLDWPLSSASVLLGVMVRLGYLEIEKPGRRFLPTLKTARLGLWVENNFKVDDTTFHIMENIAKLTGETVLLAVKHQWSALYIHVIQATNPLRLHVPTGTKRPLPLSGCGLVLLAALRDEEILSNIDKMQMPDAPDEPSANEICRKIHDVRRNGFAVTADAVTLGAGTVAVQLPYEIKGRAAVIGVGGSSTVIRQTWQEKLQIIRAEITRHAAPPIALE